MICQTSSPDAACLGAAIVAGSGYGIFTSLSDAVDHMVKVTARYTPNWENYKMYEGLYEHYVELYDALCPMFNMDEK